MLLSLTLSAVTIGQGHRVTSVSDLLFYMLILWYRETVIIVELCAGLSHTVKPHFCQHYSTLVNDRSRCFGQSERL